MNLSSVIEGVIAVSSPRLIFHGPQCIGFAKMDLERVDCCKLCATTCAAFEKNMIMSSPKEI